MGPSRSCWNGTTNALQPEETCSKGTRASSIKVPIQKNSGNLFNDPRIYIYIYIYVSNKYRYKHTHTHTHTSIYIYIYIDVACYVYKL